MERLTGIFDPMADLARLTNALADRYAVERELGSGGMATVYLAEDLKHHRKVAVKVLRPALAAVLGAERFLKEIEVTANLQHPHILPLYDSGEADTFLYYVMPYVEGETLRDKLNREKQLAVEETVQIARSVAAALDYAHQHDVIHRDIKPENILLQSGQAMVADFGIALAVSQAGGTRLTETGLSLGTPHYMSPEQATADRELDARSDVYSLGAMVYEMLVGDPPHIGSSAQAIIAKILSEKPSPITGSRDLVPANVDAAVQMALAKSPPDRFTSAAQFAEALTNPAFTLPTMQAAVAAGVGMSGRWILVTALGWSFAVLTAVVALWGWLRPEPPKPVRRYSLALPQGEWLGPTDMSRLAISPDGERVVYVGAANQGSRARADDVLESTQLFVRFRDELHATAIPGSEGGRNPFFSPDGASIGFFDIPNAIKVVSLSGGPPITVADSDVSFSGASWGPDGRIYVATFAGLVRARPSGGPVEPLTTIDRASGETAHTWPEALPNGKGVLFTVRGAESDIVVLELATQTREVLVAGVLAKYVPSGQLLYVTAEGTLMAVPFDQDALALTGEASVLVESLRVGYQGAFDLAVSASTLTYAIGAAEHNLDELVWVTREGAVEKVDPGWTADFTSLALSPDGTRLAVSIHQNNLEQLWIKQLDQELPSQLSSEGNSNARPAWTPDGQAVVFASDRRGNRDLYMRRVDGTAQAELLRDEERSIHEGSYSPDSTWLVYQVGPIGGGDLYGLRTGVDSAVPLVVTESDETSPTLSPDGRWLAYVSLNPTGYQVYVRPFPNTHDGSWLVSTTGPGWSPVWARSGRELFYQRLGGDMMSVEVLSGTTFRPSEPRVLFSTRGMRGNYERRFYDVAPGEQRFVMIRSLGSQDADQVIVVDNWVEELKAKVGS